ncbi:SDR family NAD(P)-dependent oxidoreductase [Lentibacillus sp. L22]|uniref:SDR family NAD(P)-dependent oxidoreductase n=1 Tax=Lentibacillus sp. L22 TaxID=3163028 RepID=UPI0022B0D07F|nr:SDR family NAD(P)-dependent oxidoreductase [Lentibacillus daqui]
MSVFVNNAGGVGDVCFPDVEIKQWSEVIDLNLKGVMQGVQSAIKTMDSGGDIINISSMAGVGNEPHDSPEYAVSKAAVIRLTTAISDQLIQQNVKINTFCLGWVDTPTSQKTRENMDPADIPENILSSDDIANKVRELIKSPRTGKVVVWEEDQKPYDLYD